ncbi:hypothetical protein FRC19_007076 [Serendipita sp. 401]|nr:hypothetical protein FRC19_007076 [Serendipita sp. 401]
MFSSSLWLNFFSIVISSILLVSLVFQYLLPLQSVQSIKHGRDPRPRLLYRLLVWTVVSMFLSAVLGVLYFAQRVPIEANGSISLHIPNLTQGGWIAIQFFGRFSQNIPFPFLYITLYHILQSRWYAYVDRSGDYTRQLSAKDGYAAPLPTFLGWRGKRATSIFIASMLVLLAVISTITLAAGLSVSKHGNGSLVTEADASEGVLKVLGIVDGLHSGLVAIAVLDIGVSSFFLYRRLVESKCRDMITGAMLFIVTPILVPLALVTIVTSSYHTFSSLSAQHLESIDFYELLTSTLVIEILVVVLSILYAKPSRWILSCPGGGVSTRLSQL